MESGAQGSVIAVCTGPVRPLKAGGRIHQTGFVKEPADGPVAVGRTGPEGDEHIYHDHGGPDQALLVYSVDHYPFWQSEYQLDLPTSGAFGENLTVRGLTEAEVAIGDTFQIGEVVAQITSPRSPCYKIGLRYGMGELPVRMQETLRTGYLMRVLAEGLVQSGDAMTLIDRPARTFAVDEAARVYSRDRDDWEAVERLTSIPELADAMREKLQARLANRDGGDQDARLYGEGKGEPEA